MLGAIEAGGTKMVLGVYDQDFKLHAQKHLPTLSPSETIPQMVSFFMEHPIDALGIACFGPLNLRRDTAGYGSILNTPKLAWRNFPLLNTLKKALQVPCNIDTDVNAAALAEVRLGAARGKSSCLYLTIGTGIGGGLYAEGQLVHGLLHPEWGHVSLARHPEDPLLHSVCPYHHSCAEGFASGPAMQARWGIQGKDLPGDHWGWELEAWYLGQLCANALLAVSPEMILLGGGVMHQERLLPFIRQYTLQFNNNYIDQEHLPPMEDFIASPSLWPDSGLVGAALLAKEMITN